MRTIALIGIPTDIGAGVNGTDQGPHALRRAGLIGALLASGADVVDKGDLRGPVNPRKGPVDGLRHLPEVAAWNQSVFDAVGQSLDAGMLPLIAGGDHSVAIGSISAVAKYCKSAGKNLRVLWFDAHADSNSGDTSPTGNIHGMPVACLLGHGPAALVGYAGATPAINVEEVRLIGVRAVDTEERQYVEQMQIQVFDMKFIRDHGIANVMRAVLAGLDDSTHLHVSFDMDSLDPSIAPGVGTAESGGLSQPEAMFCAEEIAKTGRLASFDIVELNPVFDTQGRTTLLAIRVVAQMFQDRSGPRLC